MDRVHLVQEQFFNSLNIRRDAAVLPQTDPQLLRDTYMSMVESRLLDYQARILKKNQEGYYTIASAGHESNAVFGMLLGKADPCLLHYRSGAFMMARARAHGYQHIRYDTLLSLCASSKDPVSGGRHKVWGNKALWVPPQTSTIASHLPKAIGMAFGISRASSLDIDLTIERDSIVFASFGDASFNHATAQTAFNSASWTCHQKLPMPIFFLCEDNGIGISVRTPEGWVASQMQSHPHIKYFEADGSCIDNVLEKAKQAIAFCRTRRQPVFFHLKVVRLFGHAGSDIETTYRSIADIEHTENLDPLKTNAQYLIKTGILDRSDILAMYAQSKKEIEDLALKASNEPQISSASEVIRALSCTDRPAKENLSLAERSEHFTKHVGFLPEKSPKKRHMAMLLNWALQDLMLKYPESVLFGEDVAQKGGVYHVTHNLQKSFGKHRVFNTLLDETTILGLAIGLGQLGCLPVPEIQYLAYYHNAQDQIRGEAASQSFFSQGAFANPMVLRIASYAYQKGFGGHFHNDHSIAALLDVPGIRILSPSRSDDAIKMLHHAFHKAYAHHEVVVYLEPIALYMQKDLHESGDGLWLSDYPKDIDAQVPIRPVQYFDNARDILIISYANGFWMSLKAAQQLKQAHGIEASVLDLRQLKPLDLGELEVIGRDYDSILVVDECRAWGGVSDRIVSQLVQVPGFSKKTFQTIQAHDTYVPLGPAANLVLPQVEGIVAQAVNMLR